MFTRALGPGSGFKPGSQSTWERWSESGLPPCNHNQSGSGSGSESRVNGAIEISGEARLGRINQQSKEFSSPCSSLV